MLEALTQAPILLPKIFHWVWIGGESLPQRDRQWLQSWKEHHPAWDCVVWTDTPGSATLDGFEEMPLPPLVNRASYDGIEQWVTGKAALASRSDIIRYEVVARYGGIYLDTDVQCLAPIDDVMRSVRLFVADEWGPSEGNYMFGATPNHQAMWTVVRELESHLKNLNQAVNAVVATGPRYLNPQLRKYVSDLVIFPHILFNPLCSYADPDQVEAWPESSLANHNYDGKWYDRKKERPPGEFLAAKPSQASTPKGGGGT